MTQHQVQSLFDLISKHYLKSKDKTERELLKQSRKYISELFDYKIRQAKEA